MRCWDRKVNGLFAFLEKRQGYDQRDGYIGCPSCRRGAWPARDESLRRPRRRRILNFPFFSHILCPSINGEGTEKSGRYGAELAETKARTCPTRPRSPRLWLREMHHGCHGTSRSCVLTHTHLCQSGALRSPHLHFGCGRIPVPFTYWTRRHVLLMFGLWAF